MFELHLLGSPTLFRITELGAESSAIQPKRLALLAYLLTCSRGGAHRRDTLTGLFWPELDQSNARGALRQALRYLRNTLGAEAIVTRGNDEVLVSEAELGCDLFSFEDALEAGDLEGALAYYRGDFLEGLYISGASPDFEHWLDRMSLRLREMAVGAAHSLSLQSAARGDLALAAQWTRRELEITPYSEPTIRRLIQLLVDSGHIAGALEAYLAFEQRLSIDLELSPSAELRALIERIRSGESPRSEGAGEADSEVARLDPTTLPLLSREDPHPVALPADQSGGPTAIPRDRGPSGLNWSAAPGVRFLLSITGAITILFAIRSWPARSTSDIEALIAVSPFEVLSADTSLHYLRADLPDLLSARLSPLMELTGTDNSFHLQGEILGRATDLTIHCLLDDGGLAPATAVGRVTGPIESLHTLVDRLAVQLVIQSLPGGVHRYNALLTTPLPLVQIYLEARRALYDGDYRTAAAGFEEVLRLAPENGLAALGLAMAGIHIPGAEINTALEIAERVRDQFDSADEAILTALRAEAVGYLEPIEERLAHWERAIEIGPDRVESWFGLGDFLYHWGAVLGIPDAHELAHSSFEQGLELDPGYGAAARHLVGVGVVEGFGRSTSSTLIRLMGMAQLDGIGLDDAEVAAGLLHAQGGADSGNWLDAYLLHHYALNRGRPAEALEFAKKIQVRRPEGILHWQLPILSALLSDGDRALAELYARELYSIAGRLAEIDSPEATRARYGALCTVALWSLHSGDELMVQGLMTVLEEAPIDGDGPATTRLRAGCITLLETLKSAWANQGASLASLEELVRAQQVGHLAWDAPHIANLFLARLYEERDDPFSALELLRRRPHHHLHGLPYLSTFLREEARLAVLVGDTATAIRAYRHYLALRDSPEPSLEGEIAQVRTILETISPD